MSCVRTIEPLQQNEQFWGLVLVSGLVLCKDFGRHAGIQRKVWQSLIEYYLEVSDKDISILVCFMCARFLYGWVYQLNDENGRRLITDHVQRIK